MPPAQRPETSVQAPRRKSSLRRWRITRALADLLAGLLALLATFSLRFYLPLPFTTGLLPRDRISFLLTAALLVVLSQNAILYFFGFYELSHPHQRPERLRRLATATLIQGVGLITFYFLTNQTFPRTVLLLFVALNFLFLAATRGALARFAGSPRRRVLIVGAGPAAMELAGSAERFPWYGFEVVGWVPTPDDDPDAPGPGSRLGELDQVPELVRAGIADEIILTSRPAGWDTDLIAALASAEGSRASVLLLPGPFQSLIADTRHRTVHDVPLVDVVTESAWQRPRLLKRGFDLVGAAVLLVVAALPMAVAALMVRLSSRGPVVYRQERVGLDRRRFTLYKLRTMRADAESGDQEILATVDDPRLTRVGRVLRALRLDELPQLFNVLGGSMSLVGPRPERPGFVERYLREVPGYATRFVLRPGLTGLAQVNGDYHSSPENKLRYELSYLANWSLWLDLAILVRTVRIVLTSKGV